MSRPVLILLLAVLFAGVPACGVKTDPIPYVQAYPEGKVAPAPVPAPVPGDKK